MKEVTYFIEEKIVNKWMRFNPYDGWPLGFVRLSSARAWAEHEFGTEIPYRIVKIEKTFIRKVVR
jgi:hypothetical protein